MLTRKGEGWYNKAMRKTFSVLDACGGTVKTFTGCHIDLAGNGMVKIYDKEAGENFPYIKALYSLLPGHTICHTEEVNG